MLALPFQLLNSSYIKHVSELERYLMEGAYHKILSAKENVPAESFAYFMESLTSTVRFVE